MLVQILADIEARTHAISASHPEWPCRRGCDHCCRHLANIPTLTEAEWQRLAPGVRSLPAHVRKRIAQLESAERPIVCPLLDEEFGACLVYDVRPVACRTYGFYADREGTLCCETIASLTDGVSVVWGNAEAVERRIDALGPRRTLTAWFNDERSASTA